MFSFELINRITFRLHNRSIIFLSLPFLIEFFIHFGTKTTGKNDVSELLLFLDDRNYVIFERRYNQFSYSLSVAVAPYRILATSLDHTPFLYFLRLLSLSLCLSRSLSFQIINS